MVATTMDIVPNVAYYMEYGFKDDKRGTDEVVEDLQKQGWNIKGGIK